MTKLLITTDVVVILDSTAALAQQTVSDLHMQRIRTAFGHFVGASPVWVDATTQEVVDALKNYLKGQVLEYEVRLANQAKRTEIGGEIW